jgi:hypothetical protein
MQTKDVATAQQRVQDQIADMSLEELRDAYSELAVCIRLWSTSDSDDIRNSALAELLWAAGLGLGW